MKGIRGNIVAYYCLLCPTFVSVSLHGDHHTVTMLGLFLASLSLGDITGDNVGIISGQPQSWRYYRRQCWDYFWPASVLEILPETMLGLFLAGLSLGDITGDNVGIISGQPQSWRYYRRQCWDYFWPASVSLDRTINTNPAITIGSLSLCFQHCRCLLFWPRLLRGWSSHIHK